MDAHHRKTQQQESRATADCRGNKLLNETAGIEMHQSEPIDIMTISETWLKNNPHLIRYITTPGYNCLFCNRDAIRGGDVGVYMRSHQV